MPSAGNFLRRSQQALFFGTILGGVSQEGVTNPRRGEAILDRRDNFREERIGNADTISPTAWEVLPPQVGGVAMINITKFFYGS